MKKTLITVCLMGMCALAFVVIPASEASAQWIWPPPSYYGYWTPPVRPWGNPTWHQVGPWGTVDRWIDAGRIQSGLPPIYRPNSSGGTDIVYSRLPNRR